MLVLSRQPRPLELRFLRHKEWERGPNGLPEIDFALVEEVFERHDRKDLGSLNGTQFAALMAEVHELSCIMLGREVDNSYYPIEFAQRLIDAHDKDNDGFSFDEAAEWVASGLNACRGASTLMSRGGWYIPSIRFLEDITIAGPVEAAPETDPEPKPKG